MICEASDVGTNGGANELASLFQSHCRIEGNARDDDITMMMISEASKCVDVGNDQLGTTPALSSDVVADDRSSEIRDHGLVAKHKIFLSHSGAQKSFVADLCDDLMRLDRYPFFDILMSSLPVGDKFPNLIFDAIRQCQVGVVVLSEEFFTRSKWPMLELVAMWEESKKPNQRIKIIPVFYSISRDKRCRDPKVQDGWMAEYWKKWEEEDKMRIDLGKWKSALGIFGSTTGLEMKGGMLDKDLRAKIVEAVCMRVLPEMRWDDSRVEGKTRLCKEILKKVFKGLQPKDLKGGVQKVGLYGVGGIGKTTACKILCNKLCGEYCNRVCHVELGSQVSKLELLRKVLGAFSDLDAKILDKISNFEVGYGYLKTHIVKERVFLALDNVSDESKEQAKSFLQAKFEDGSVVLLTARSMDQLQRLGVRKEDCFPMPELELEEAKCLFLCHAGMEKNKVDEVFVETCVRRCYFYKGQSSSGLQGDAYHFHPLALTVLGAEVGEEISQHGVGRQAALLTRIGTFNLSRQQKHPVFSILRSSFDSLLEEDQLLFLLVAALLSPFFKHNEVFMSGALEWLGSVAQEKDNEPIELKLEVLKRKSLLQSFGKYTEDFSMHDLWREFAAAEMEGGRFIDRYFFEEVRKCDGKVDLTGFPLMRAVKLGLEDGVVLDVCGLKQLKSLHVFSREYSSYFVMNGLGTLESLTYVRLRGVAPSTCIAELGLLTNLRVVKLVYFKVDRTLPDMSKLASLRVLELNLSMSLESINLQNLINLVELHVYVCRNLESIYLRNLTSLTKLFIALCPNLESINIQNLTSLTKCHIETCERLQSVDTFRCRLMTKLAFCRSVRFSLGELNVSSCALLPSLDTLGDFKKLRKLDITGCSSIQELKHLGDMAALEELRAMHCDKLAVLPVCCLPTLRVLEIETWKVPAGFRWNFTNIVVRPIRRPIRRFRRTGYSS